MDVDVIFVWVIDRIKMVFLVNFNNLIGMYLFFEEVKWFYE